MRTGLRTRTTPVPSSEPARTTGRSTDGIPMPRRRAISKATSSGRASSASTRHCAAHHSAALIRADGLIQPQGDGMSASAIDDFDAARAAVNAGMSPGDAARDLVAKMSPEERLWCLDGDLPGLTGLTFIGLEDGYHRAPFHGAVVERLGVPGIAFADGPRGSVLSNSTCFPVSMARGATWDPDLEERVGVAIGAELRASGATLTGAVCVNVLRHPAWGRAQETYGEDPFLVGELGAAFTRGLQRHVMACAKHYACNSMEN